MISKWYKKGLIGATRDKKILYGFFQNTKCTFKVKVMSII